MVANVSSGAVDDMRATATSNFTKNLRCISVDTLLFFFTLLTGLAYRQHLYEATLKTSLKKTISELYQCGRY